MKKVLNIFLICFLLAPNVTAQEELTISSAIKKTLENNLDIEVSENLKRIAKNNSSILNNNYLPNIQLGSEINTNIQSIEIETIDSSGGQLGASSTLEDLSNLSFDLRRASSASTLRCRARATILSKMSPSSSSTNSLETSFSTSSLRNSPISSFIFSLSS